MTSLKCAPSTRVLVCIATINFDLNFAMQFLFAYQHSLNLTKEN